MTREAGCMKTGKKYVGKLEELNYSFLLKGMIR